MTKETFNIVFAKASRIEGVEPFDVANLAVDFDCAYIQLDGREVPADSIKYLIGYGIKQTLADSYSQPTTQDKCQVAYAKKLAGIFEGMVFNENGNRGDPVRGEMRELALAAILGGKSRGAWLKANGENAEKLLTAKVNRVLELNADKLRARAESIIAERKAEAAALDLGEDDEPEVEVVLIKGKNKKTA